MAYESEGGSWMARTTFPPNKPKTEGVLHKNAGRFLLYSGIEKYEQMFYYNFTTTHDGTIWELLKIVRIWYII